MNRFSLSEHPIPENGLLASNDVAGAVATFTGIVRDHNEGRVVKRLEYEAYPELALKEGEQVLSEALSRFPILDAACIHRYGMLEIGDVAIRVQASGAHRAEAFQACEWIVDEIKRRVPIWKKEHYADGEAEWVNATTGGKPEVVESTYYSRQDLIADRTKIAAAKILVVGAGGLGSPALTYLAGAGIGRLTIIDPDRVEVSNLYRQVLYGTDDLGLPKVIAAARRLRNLNPFVDVQPIEGRLDEANAIDLVSQHNLVLDGTDRLATKFLLNRVCVALAKPLIIASVYQFEGQLQIVKPGGPCLECLWPTPPEDGCVGTCAETGVLGVAPGMLGTMQAAEALKLILGLPVVEGVVTVDLIETRIETLKLQRRPTCPVCGEHSSPLAEMATIPLEIDSFAPERFELIDIREVEEVDRQASGLPNIPLSDWKLPKHDKPLLLVCASGRRSLSLTKRLRSEGVEAFSLAGGLPTLIRSGNA